MHRYNIKFKEKTYDVVVRECLDDRAMLDINGKRYMIDRTTSMMNSVGADMANFPRVNALGIMPDTGSSQPVAAVKESVTSPLPGSVLEILCKTGASVAVGDILVKLEAMKMETDIQAQVAGTVQAIRVNVGDSVQQGQIMVEIA